MADSIRDKHPSATIELLGGGKGDFIVIVDGTQIWDKQREGDFPSHAVILSRLPN